jgi:hypothetical protein
MTEKVYFENEDANTAHSESYFQEQMKEKGISQITVLEAIRIPYSKADHVWCTELEDCSEKSECNKNCTLYKPRNGKNGRCEFRGQLCEYGEEVILKLES